MRSENLVSGPPDPSPCKGPKGDPLGPFLFNLALAPSPNLNLWYLDDGVIVGHPELLQKAWDIIRLKGPALSLHPNPSKCEWIWLDTPGVPPVPWLPSQIPVTPFDDLSILQVPLGSPEAVASFVEKKLLGGLKPVLEKLMAFEDTQAAVYLLRVSYSAVRAVHFMRTTPLSHWHSIATSFDSSVRRAFESIVGFPLSQTAYAQACLPKLGSTCRRRF